MSTTSNKKLSDLIALDKKLRAFGFPWSNHKAVMNKVKSECDEVMEAILQKEGDDRIQEELGDLIHTAITWCLFAGYDVNKTIHKTVSKIAFRLNFLQEIARSKGLENLKEQPLSVRQTCWNEAKKTKPDT